MKINLTFFVITSIHSLISFIYLFIPFLFSSFLWSLLDSESTKLVLSRKRGAQNAVSQ